MVVEYLTIENPEVLAVCVAVILFVVIFSIFIKVSRINRGIVIAMSFFISAITAWKLYNERFYDLEISFAIILIIIVVVILLKIIWAFFKSIFRNSFR